MSTTAASQKAPAGAELEALRAAAQDEVRALRSRIVRLDSDGLDLILRGARSHYAWTDRPVSDDDLRTLYDIVKMGPTSMNSCPARFFFIRTAAAKERLAKALKPANVAKMLGAPVTAIIAHDLEFWHNLPQLFPHEDRRGHFSDKPDHAADTAYRNATLQGAYLMIAARAMGFDIGAMSGFSNEIVDREFFAETNLRSNFLCNIGYADESALFQRLPRFRFDEVCELM